MKNKKLYKKIIIIFLIVVLIMILVCFVLLNNSNIITEDGFIDISQLQFGDNKTNNSQTNTTKDSDIKYNPRVQYDNLVDLLKAFNSYYLFEERDSNQILSIYVKFPKDLFNEEGIANKEYFEELLKRLANYVEDRRFILHDDNLEITIMVTRDDANNEVKYKINNLSNYFEEFNYDKYKESKENTIVQKQSIPMINNAFKSIYDNGMVLNKSLGDAEYAYGRYTYYQNGTIKLTTRNAMVLNMVFLDGYPDEIVEEINTKSTIEQVYEKYPNFAFGGPSQGYLGYRTDDVYLYVYNDEISVVTYGHVDDNKMVDFIDEYFKTRNLEAFQYNVSSYWKGYDEYEYNPDTRYFKITYPNFGLSIEIFGNASANINVYSNYKIGERMAKLIGEGRVNLIKDVDSINEWEQKRRLNEESEKSQEYREYKRTNVNVEETKEQVDRNEVEVITIN